MLNQENEQSSPEEQIRNAHRELLALNHAREGETQQLLAMIQEGLAVNLADSSQNTLLLLACYYGHATTARMLIQQGADVERRNVRGQTPLGAVAFRGYDGVAEVLLEYGADPDADSGAGATPMMFATMFERKSMIALFEAHLAASRAKPA